MNVDVKFYTKTYSRCTQCDSMKTALLHWAEEHPEHDLEVEFVSVEEHLDEVQAKYPKAQSAPIVEVTRGRSTEVVSGNNPDILEDLLSGLDSVWDDL